MPSISRRAFDLSPDRMTPAQRRREIAKLLALGLVRLRERNAKLCAVADPENAFELGFSGHPSVDGDPVNESTRTSR
nr:hypothetical protein [Gammaproteobacteria bacterium]